MTIELKNGRLTHNGETLFVNLSLRAEGGQTCVVDNLPQKAHKPFLHALMGLLPLNEGFVSIDGEPLNERSAGWLRQFMAYVPQNLRWPDEERFRGMSDEEVHRRLLENAATGDSQIVFVEGIFGADDETLCRQMAQSGKAVVVCREKPVANKPIAPPREPREGELF